MIMPFQILGFWLRGIWSIAILVGAAYFLWQCADEHRTVVIQVAPITMDETPEPGIAEGPAREIRDARPQEASRQVVPWAPGLNLGTYYLLGGLALLAWALSGRWVASPLLFRRSGGPLPAPRDEISDYVVLEDGSKIRFRVAGRSESPTVILTHGWGLDSREWVYARSYLEADFRVVTWDLPGLGDSERPEDRDWSLNRLAQILDRLISKVGDKPVTLLGHSIGGMITLTFCKQFPESLRTRVNALVIAQSTYTNPILTTLGATIYRPLQEPLLRPLCWGMIGLAPIFRVLNWLSYLNGSAARSVERSSFSGDETREQLESLTRAYCEAPPDVVGRGMLAMMDYDATTVLNSIPVPVLVVTGDRDSTCLPQASSFIVSNVLDGRLVVLPNSRHCGLFEHHQAFHELLEEFLAQICAARIS